MTRTARTLTIACVVCLLLSMLAGNNFIGAGLAFVGVILFLTLIVYAVIDFIGNIFR